MEAEHVHGHDWATVVATDVPAKAGGADVGGVGGVGVTPDLGVAGADGAEVGDGGGAALAEVTINDVGASGQHSACASERGQEASGHGESILQH